MTTTDITLIGIEGREDHASILKLCRVLNYCSILLPFYSTILLSYLEPPTFFTGRWFQIPVLDYGGFNIFDSRCLHRFVASHFVLTVHCDGFILNPQHWTDDFLHYDFIGAPWEFGTGQNSSAPSIGNGGFCLRSLMFLWECGQLPWHNRVIPGDAFYCLHHRERLELLGMKFAPVAMAEQFSCENGHRVVDPFGFHRNTSLMNDAWSKLSTFEATQPAKEIAL